jgi:hypothetical protein
MFYRYYGYHTNMRNANKTTHTHMSKGDKAILYLGFVRNVFLFISAKNGQIHRAVLHTA